MRSIVLVALVLLVTGPVRALEHVLKDPEGATLGILVDCSSCKEAKPKDSARCASGVEDGYRNGEPCGKCLMQSNFGAGVVSAYDIKVSGRLLDHEGKPLSAKFVQMRMANTWGVKARTGDDGQFVIRLGATRARKGSTPASLEVGDLRLPKDSKEGIYTLYLLPQNYKPCSESDKKKD